MTHPLDFISVGKRKLLFWTLLTGTLVLFAVFRGLDAPLRTSAAPNGIVSFELAGSPEAARAILDSWDERASLFAAFGLGLDYLFMPLYALALASGTLLAAGRHNGWFKALGGIAGWGALAAALFDAVENFALWKVLLGGVFSTWPRVASICASFKSGLLLFGLLIAALAWLWPRKGQ